MSTIAEPTPLWPEEVELYQARCNTIRECYKDTWLSTKVDFVIKNAGESSPPAWFDPLADTITINNSLISLKRSPEHLLRGVILHELGHKTWTRFSLDELNKFEGRVRMVITWFEEVRVEMRVVDAIRNTSSLRASFNWLLKSLLETPPSTNLEKCGLWILTVGRHLAGVCGESEVDKVDMFVREEFGDEVVTFMGEILSEALIVSPYLIGADYLGQLKSLAEEFIQLTSSASDSTETEMLHILDGCTEPTEGESESESNSSHEAALDSASDVVMSDTESDAPENFDRTEQEKEFKEAIEKLSKSLDETSYHEIRMHDPRTELKAANASKKSVGIKSAVNPEVRSQAVKLGKVFMNMQMPTVTKKLSHTQTPPGKLDGREVIRLSADRARGRMSTARPWKTVKRQHTQAKPVKIACLTDVSGSMYWAESLAAEFAWVVATAGSRINADTLSLAYGDAVYPVTWPGETPQKITTIECKYGSEAFSKAAAVADGVLNLSRHNQEAKIVFNLTDGQYVVRDEPQRAKNWVAKWQDAGTRVVWVVQSDYIGEMVGRTYEGAEIVIGSDTKTLVDELAKLLRTF